MYILDVIKTMNVKNWEQELKITILNSIFPVEGCFRMFLSLLWYIEIECLTLNFLKVHRFFAKKSRKMLSYNYLT